jgi:NAD(P)-dependent dehydrogenase (short-subunit alcohol dehydrogenase family)
MGLGVDVSDDRQVRLSATEETLTVPFRHDLEAATVDLARTASARRSRRISRLKTARKRWPWRSGRANSYSAGKAAVHMLTRHLARRLAPEQITVNAIAPAPFDSKMMAFLLDVPEARAEVERRVPLGRIGRPDDAAGLTLFLASRAGSYLTGAVIPLDGGITGCG